MVVLFIRPRIEQFGGRFMAAPRQSWRQANSIGIFAQHLLLPSEVRGFFEASPLSPKSPAADRGCPIRSIAARMRQRRERRTLQAPKLPKEHILHLQ